MWRDSMSLIEEIGLSQLPRDLRKVWELRGQGLSISATGTKLGVPEDRVRWQLKRAMTRLKRPDPLARLHRG